MCHRPKVVKQPSVTELYEIRRKAVTAQIAALSLVVENHSKKGITWGHVGDLGMIQERLADLLSSFQPQ